MTTLTNLLSALRTRAGLESDDTYFSDTVLTSLINQALKQVNTEYDWPWAQTIDVTALTATVTGQREYDVPTGWRATKRIQIDNRHIERISPNDAVQYANDQGAVLFYYIENEHIYLDPAPNSVKTVTHIYYTSEVDLVAGGDEPAIPSVYDDYLLSVAGILLSVRKKDAELMAMFRAERLDWVRRIRDDIRRGKASVRIKARQDWSVDI